MPMNIVILDDYQDVVRKLESASKLDAYSAKVYTNTVKGLGQLSVRLKDADILVLIRERTHLNRQLIEKLPRLKLISQTGHVGTHIDLEACSERGIAAPKALPQDIADRLQKAIQDTLTDPEFLKTIKNDAPLVAFMPGAEWTKSLESMPAELQPFVSKMKE